MKIAIVLPHFYPYVGGGEKMFYDLAKGLLQRGHEVRVVARNVGDEYCGEKVVDGIPVRYCRWKSAFGHPLPNPKDIAPAIQWCDVVHTSIFTTSPVVSYLAKKYHKKSLLTIYEARGKKWYWADSMIRATAFFVVEQISCRMPFDCYHAISDATKRDVETYCGKKNVKRVYLANEMEESMEDPDFSLRNYFGIPEDSKVFLYYGRPGKTKGVQVYEKAIRLLSVKNRLDSNVRFCFLLGKEPEDLRAQFIQQIHQDGLAEFVKIGDSVTREQLAAAIHQADCVVVPSLTEGFGFSALEACQMGAKLIYSDGGSLPEVTFGTCKAFKNRDAVDLARKIYRVMRGKSDAFDTVEEKKFTYEEMIGGLEKLYLDMFQ